MPSSSNACWRQRAHDLPDDPLAGRRHRTQLPFALSSTHRSGGRIGPIAFWIVRMCAASAERTLRSYAMDLLHFLRWWTSLNGPPCPQHLEEMLSASVLLDYSYIPKLASNPQLPRLPSTHRVGVVDRAPYATTFRICARPASHPDFTISIGGVRRWVDPAILPGAEPAERLRRPKAHRRTPVGRSG